MNYMIRILFLFIILLGQAGSLFSMKNRTCFIVVVSQTLKEEDANMVKENVVFFGLLPKYKMDSAFKQISNKMQRGLNGLDDLMDSFYVIDIYFPINNKVESIFAIDTLYYNKQGISLDSNRMNIGYRSAMFFSEIFDLLWNSKYCSHNRVFNEIGVIEFEGTIHFVKGKVKRDHIINTDSLLSKIEIMNSGNHLFKSVVGDTLGNISNHRFIVHCNVNIRRLGCRKGIIGYSIKSVRRSFFKLESDTEIVKSLN